MNSPLPECSRPDASLVESLQAHRGSGTPVFPQIRSVMERVSGASLGKVRIHIEPKISALNARALAFGPDLFFVPGAYDPISYEGRLLLCHEMAHAAQYELGLIPSFADAPPVPVVRSCVLERHANAVAEAAMAVVQGGPYVNAGIEWTSARTRHPARVMQLQEKGIVGGFALGSPADADYFALAGNTVIFRQIPSTNEVFRSRDLARDRARLKCNIGGKALRTYYSNPAHTIGVLGEGRLLTFAQDRALNPQQSYGRYYDFGHNLLVEHTDDVECRLIEITGINALNVTYRCWATLPHFHMASYDAHWTTYHNNANVDAVQRMVNGPPPGYAQQVVDGHHIYYFPAVAPAVQNVAVPAFTAAFAAGAQAVFNLVWFW